MNFELNEKEIMKAERNMILQAFAEVYVKEFGMPKDLKEVKVPDVYGDINSKQAALLHLYMVKEHERMGLDLNKCIEANGEKIIPGKLSKYECDQLMYKADEQLLLLTEILNRREKHINKEI